MNTNARIMFIELVGGYLIFRDDSETPLAPKEEAAINEIMNWNAERAIEYFKKKYPDHAHKFKNGFTFKMLTEEDRIDIIQTEMEEIMENMIVS